MATNDEIIKRYLGWHSANVDEILNEARKDERAKTLERVLEILNGDDEFHVRTSTIQKIKEMKE